MAKNYLLTFLLFQLVISNNLQAQGAGQAGEFLRWGVGTKALGLGRAFTSVADDASSLYWNPAGLSSLSRVGGTFMFTHVPLLDGASFNYMAAGLPLRLFFVSSHSQNSFLNVLQNLNVGLGFLWHSLGQFEFYNEDASRSVDQSQNTIAQSAVYVSLSYPITQLFHGLSSSGILSPFSGDLEIGLTTKFINQDLFGLAGSATGLDLGLKYTHHSEVFSMGFALRDFNRSRFSYHDDLLGDRLPAYGVLGASFAPPFGFMQGLLLAFDYGVIKPAGRDRDVMFGLQYDFSQRSSGLPIKLRIGTNSLYENLTVGINFSPELIWGNDWLPSGELTFTNDKTSFDAAGGRYSISLDRNPFNAKYWYENAISIFPISSYSASTIETGYSEIRKSLRNAEKAKNPGNRAYRYEAALRNADLNFLSGLSALRGTTDSYSPAPDKSAQTFLRVSKMYDKRTAKFLIKDTGKSEIDFEAYFNSFANYAQSLILSNNPDKAVLVCADGGRAWGKRLNVFGGGSERFRMDKVNLINYLQAFALYESNFKTDALNLVAGQLANYLPAKYLFAHIAFSQEDYHGVLNSLQEVDFSQTGFPMNIYLPLTTDHTFGDEILFLRAASFFKISDPLNSKEFLAEFAKIPRFFPNSDLAKFLTNGEPLLFKLTQYYEDQNLSGLNDLVNKMIKSYMESFSNGALKEQTYTYHYR